MSTEIKTALVVDDSKMVSTIHAGMLKELGYTCDTAENGFVGLELLFQKSYDLVLVDINMPKMNGFELVTRIRASDQEFAKIPILMISTESTQQDKAKALAHGVTVYLVKPLTRHALELILNELQAA